MHRQVPVTRPGDGSMVLMPITPIGDGVNQETGEDGAMRGVPL